jgi:hypothetical protein
VAARTLGIDLAASAVRTAACTIEWGGRGAFAQVHPAPQDDEALLRLMRGADRVGIDCPLGWPIGFVDAIAAHRDGRAWPGRGVADAEEYRRRLAYRRTDLAIEGRRPLSVSTDRIGVVALRCALLLDAYEPPRPGVPVDRSGAGAVAEVYPAAALRRWGLPTSGYKDDPAALTAALRASVPWLGMDESDWDRCARSDHALDALVCALVTRAVTLGLTSWPGDADREVAAAEGWIHVPTCPLDALAV